MSQYQDPTEYHIPPEEEALPPEQPETLSDKRRYTEASGDVSPTLSPQEEAASSEEGAAKSKASQKQEKRKRTLLLQFAAAAASVILVTNSFGLDLLGRDSLSGGSAQESITVPSGERPDFVTEPEIPETEPAAESSAGQTTEPAAEPQTEPETESVSAPTTGEPATEALPEPDYPGLPVGGDSKYPDLPNRWPNTALPGAFFDSDQEAVTLNEDYIQLFDRTTDTWEFLYLNDIWGDETVTREGISYDRVTNTLTLNGYRGGGISANLLGNSFTIELIGENELTQDLMIWGFYTGGSVRFTGSGSLTINSSLTQAAGLSLYCEYSESAILIDPGVTLDIYGAENALAVVWTRAEKGIFLKTETPIAGVRQLAVSEETAAVLGEEEQTYSVWILTDNEGQVLTHWHLEAEKVSDPEREPGVYTEEEVLSWRELIPLTMENVDIYAHLAVLPAVSPYTGYYATVELARDCYCYDRASEEASRYYCIEFLYSMSAYYSGTREVTARIYRGYHQSDDVIQKYEMADPDLSDLRLLSVSGTVQLLRFPSDVDWQTDSYGREYIIVLMNDRNGVYRTQFFRDGNWVPFD